MVSISEDNLFFTSWAVSFRIDIGLYLQVGESVLIMQPGISPK